MLYGSEIYINHPPKCLDSVKTKLGFSFTITMKITLNKFISLKEYQGAKKKLEVEVNFQLLISNFEM